MFHQPTEPTAPYRQSAVAAFVRNTLDEQARKVARENFVALLSETFADVAREYDLNPRLLAQVAAMETAL